jgi:hypothetical protein
MFSGSAMASPQWGHSDWNATAGTVSAWPQPGQVTGMLAPFSSTAIVFLHGHRKYNVAMIHPSQQPYELVART